MNQRIIKYRAWDDVRKKMYSPSSISWKNNVVWVCDSYGDNRGEYELELPNSWLMQSTGLHDKNGKEIWEGDIVKYKEIIDSENERQRYIQDADYVYLDFVGEVIWDMEGASFDIKGMDKNYRGFGARGRVEIEIIGNIYESPELLK